MGASGREQGASQSRPASPGPPHLSHLVAVGLVLLDEPETRHQHGVIRWPRICSKSRPNQKKRDWQTS